MEIVRCPNWAAGMDCPDFPAGSLESWVARLTAADFPVLRSTTRQLARLAIDDGDSIGPRDIAKIVIRDPLMSAKLYMHSKRVLGDHKLAEITTVDRLILMLGVPPLLRAFASQPLVEDMLRGNLPALSGLMRVMRRARHAADIAGAFAAKRNDPSFEEIMISALLHDLAEMLLWCCAPTLALETQGRLDADQQLRSATAQRAVFGTGLNELQLELVRHWALPNLLVQLMDDGQAGHPRVRCVTLAVNIARHSLHGWDNAALPDDFLAAAELLSTTPEHVIEMVRAGGSPA